MPLVLHHHALITKFFSSFLSHLPTFFTKIGPLDAPHQGGCPGPTHRSHPRLHATAQGGWTPLIQSQADGYGGWCLAIRRIRVVGM